MTVSILGSGWYGFTLAETLVAKGYSVKGSTTSTSKMAALSEAGIQPFMVSFDAGTAQYDADFFACDSLWICIPPRHKAGQGASYPGKISAIIAAAKKHKVKNVVLISSSGVFGDLNGQVTERTTPRPGGPAGIAILQAEQLLQAETGFTATIIRFAGLVGPGRHPGRFFAGKKNIPNGQSPVNLIHLTDCVGISMAILAQGAFGGIYHACSPDHPAKAHFYTLAASSAGLPLPEFVAERVDWKLFSGVEVEKRLGYPYAVNDWEQWLKSSDS